MSALSTGLRLQVFSFLWQGSRALNPRRGQTPPTPHRHAPSSTPPPALTSTTSSPLTTQVSVTLPRRWVRVCVWEGEGLELALIHSAGAALISSEVQQRISGEYHEKPGLQSECDGTAIGPTATGASLCASADKEHPQ